MSPHGPPTRVGVQIESVHVRLYRQLRLTLYDCAKLASHWETGRRRHRALDPPFQAAVQRLQRLTQVADMPAAFLAHVGSLAGGHTCTRPDLDRDFADAEYLSDNTHEDAAATAAASGDFSEESTGRGLEGLSLGRAKVQSPRTEGRMALLGASAEATLVATQTVLALWRVHDAHGRVIGEVRTMQYLPAVLLEPLKMARVLGTHVMSGEAPADVLQLCQLAAAQQRWRATRTPSAGVPGPLPSYQWLQAAAVSSWRLPPLLWGS